MSQLFWRPKMVQILFITHYICIMFPACQMLSDCHWCTERNAKCNIVHRIVLHKPIGSENAWNLLWLMTCLKIVQENIGWPNLLDDRPKSESDSDIPEVQNSWTPIWLMTCLKIVQENIGWPNLLDDRPKSESDSDIPEVQNFWIPIYTSTGYPAATHPDADKRRE